MTGTVAEWLARRTPPPPAALADRLRAALGAEGAAPAAGAHDALLAAAERLTRRLLDAGATGRRDREAALDLLCADALVTYAFEAAADMPDAVGARADAALTRFAALAQ